MAPPQELRSLAPESLRWRLIIISIIIHIIIDISIIIIIIVNTFLLLLSPSPSSASSLPPSSPLPSLHIDGFHKQDCTAIYLLVLWLYRGGRKFVYNYSYITLSLPCEKENFLFHYLHILHSAAAAPVIMLTAWLFPRSWAGNIH